MPVVGEFHGQYWATTDTTAPPDAVVSRGGYQVWQASVTMNSVVFGPPVWDGLRRLWAVLRERFALWRRMGTWSAQDRAMVDSLFETIQRLDAEQQLVLARAAEAMQSPNWTSARSAVRQTATTLGFNRPEAWLGLGRKLKADQSAAENTFRHLNAFDLLTEASRAQGSTMTNPERHLLTELAYQGFAAKGR